MFKNYIRSKLEGYVKQYFRKHSEVKLVIVVGSVGKTSTKMAIAAVLAQKLRVRLHEGNHNSELSAPLAMLGVEFPNNIRSLGQWLAVFRAARQRIVQPTDVDVIVQEVGTDRIGQVPHFGTFATPDIAVVTAVSAEHMEYFKTLDAVATEELAAANYSKATLINRDDIDGKYAIDISNQNLNTYGTTDVAEYRFDTTDFSVGDGFSGLLYAPEWQKPVEASVKVIGEHSVRAAVAAAAVGIKLGLSVQEIQKGLKAIRAVAGRMNILRGLNGSIIIDDTYNSSPLAVDSAIRALYQMSSPRRIAVLGSMNELGDTSAAEHEAVGKLCDPAELAYVVTVGEEAKKYLAPAARARGCEVVSFDSPLEAGAFVHSVLEPGLVVLFKGSQGGIFLEEAVKVILHSTDDEAQLVRQSPDWLVKKKKFFDSLQTT